MLAISQKRARYSRELSQPNRREPVQLRVVGPMEDDLIRKIGQRFPEVEVITGERGLSSDGVEAVVA